MGRSVGADSLGNVYVIGEVAGTSGGALILKYDSAGNLLWQRGWTALRGNLASSGVVDTAGNVYVTGSVWRSSFIGNYINESAFLLKLDAQGNLVWQRMLTSSRYFSRAIGIALDPMGGIYLAGTSIDPYTGDIRILFLKSDLAGNLVWEKVWRPVEGSLGGAGASVALDSTGNLYVAGVFDSGTFGLDALLLKVNSTGDIIWQERWGGGGDQGAGSVVLDSQNNIYLAGEAFSSRTIPVVEAFLHYSFLLKLSIDGSIRWEKLIPVDPWGGVGLELGTLIPVSNGPGLAADTSGNEYLAGQVETNLTNSVDAAILKISQAGDIIWQRTFGSSSQQEDFKDTAYEISVDQAGAVLVIGYTEGPPPYGFANPQISLFSVDFPVTTANGVESTANFAFSNANGTINTPQGNQTYNGLADLFLYRFAGPEAVPPLFTIHPVAMMAVLLASVLLVTLRVRSRDNLRSVGSV